jgi:PiT family inorganic phosphate transporter
MVFVLILTAVVVLAYANGANDNFKGVATLFGSGTTNYRSALAWATLTTLLGSLTAVFLAEGLLQSFSGKGLVNDALVANARYGAAVALGAGMTVLLASRLGMPISTTHALVGGLVGAAAAAGSAVDLQKLGGSFFLPLLVSPLLALAVTGVCYPALHATRRRLGITEETCFCVGREAIEVVPAMSHAAAFQRLECLSVQVGDTVTCQNRYQGRMLGIEAAVILDRLHFLSAGIVSYARGLNDTPKIAALLLLAPSLGGLGSTALVGCSMAVGGVLSARRVAGTMSQKITRMNHGQGLTANLVTGVIVVAASRLGLPVSTTHVSCGTLFGVAAVTGEGHARTIGRIVGAWLLTLPLGAALGALAFSIVSRL